MTELSELLIGQCDSRRLRRVQQAKRSGKTLHAMMVGRIFLVGRCNGAAIRIMKAKLGERDIVESSGLRELAPGNRQQQRLHDQCIDRERANQSLPEGARFQSCLIWSNAHVHTSYDTRPPISPKSTGSASPEVPSLRFSIVCRGGVARLIVGGRATLHAEKKSCRRGISHYADLLRVLGRDIRIPIASSAVPKRS